MRLANVECHHRPCGFGLQFIERLSISSHPAMIRSCLVIVLLSAALIVSGAENDTPPERRDAVPAGLV